MNNTLFALTFIAWAVDTAAIRLSKNLCSLFRGGIIAHHSDAERQNINDLWLQSIESRSRETIERMAFYAAIVSGRTRCE